MCVIHLDAKDWLTKLIENKHSIQYKTIVLDQGIAGIIYYFSNDKKDIYYLDQFYSSSLKEKELSNISFYDLHKQIYVKMLLLHSQSLQNGLCHSKNRPTYY